MSECCKYMAEIEATNRRAFAAERELCGCGCGQLREPAYFIGGAALALLEWQHAGFCSALQHPDLT